MLGVADHETPDSHLRADVTELRSHSEDEMWMIEQGAKRMRRPGLGCGLCGCRAAAGNRLMAMRNQNVIRVICGTPQADDQYHRQWGMNGVYRCFRAPLAG